LPQMTMTTKKGQLVNTVKIASKRNETLAIIQTEHALRFCQYLPVGQFHQLAQLVVRQSVCHCYMAERIARLQGGNEQYGTQAK